eukprot:1703932-Prymnesium_polylepis.2
MAPAALNSFMAGGADSYNMLVPHSNCIHTHHGRNLDAEYEAVRGVVHIPKHSLHPINGTTGRQPCGTFGVHPALPFLAEQYTEGNAAFLANIGGLVEPVLKSQFRGRHSSGVRLPPSLFAHNIMQRAAQSVHAQAPSAKGVLGRIVDHLRSQPEPYASQMYSIDGANKIVESVSLPGANFISASSGVTRFHDLAEVAGPISNITSTHSTSIFADTYTDLVNTSLDTTEALGALYDGVDVLNQTFATDSLSKQFSQVAKMIKLRRHNLTERDAFFVNLGGFDAHLEALNNVQTGFSSINAALQSFVQEMVAEG